MANLRDAATELLMLLAKAADSPDNGVDGPFLRNLSNLSVREINDAMTLLRDSGYVQWIQFLETADFVFSRAWATSLGRFEAERLSNILVVDPIDLSAAKTKQITQEAKELTDLPVQYSQNWSLYPFKVAEKARVALHPVPVGSPFGFRDEDWERIAERSGQGSVLFVVMGLQFKSKMYEVELLKANAAAMFEKAVAEYNSKEGSWPTTLSFEYLGAGYGEHLFNEIARDIISADIAVFDTSDLNSNVMIELGVALTWDVRVLPIREHTSPKPPTDISGQTYAEYSNSASTFLDSGHHQKLVRMVERAVLKKQHRAQRQ